MDLSNHPIQFAIEFSKNLPDGSLLTFDIYEYIPQSIIDNRDSFQMKPADITEEWFKGVLDTLPSTKEICLNSKVFNGKEILHIPMIDYATEDAKDIRVVETLLPVQPQYYSSGRSFHAYFPTLVNEDEWSKFMGGLLLCNDDKNIVDDRWIGHRLMGGFSSLRWSCNTTQYKKLPTCLDVEPKNQKKNKL
jgi:hypothetical protein